MNKRASCYLVFITFMMFCVMQSVFAQFSVTVVNKSDIVYKNVNLIITPVGFDAPYGRITIDTEEITPGKRKTFSYKYQYLTIPLTGTSVLSEVSEDCNLNLSIIAIPRQDSAPVQTYEHENILSKEPKIVWEEDPLAFRTALTGIRPPDMQITLTNGVNGAEKIMVSFTENSD